MGAFNGNGVFVRSYNWTQDAANGIDITASRFDTEDNGFAGGLSNCITRDGQGAPTAAIQWGNQNLTAVNAFGADSATIRAVTITTATVTTVNATNISSTGDTSIGGALTVTGATSTTSLTASGAFTVNGVYPTILGGALTVNGVTTLGTANVSSASIYALTAGSLTVNGTLTSGASTLSSATVTNDLNVGGTITGANMSVPLGGAVKFGDPNFYASASSNIRRITFNSGNWLQVNVSTGVLAYGYGNVVQFSVDASGNAIFRGTVTQNGTPIS